MEAMEKYQLKIKTLPEVKKEIEQLKAQGKRIVFTNGVFDLLHPGHTRYLSAARKLGDYLIVAVNSDPSVKAIKGPERPILGQDDRMELLAALSSVDAVVLFHEDNPLKIIEYLVPHVLVKGGDWSEDEIIGADAVKEAGGEVKRIPFAVGYSSSTILEKIRGCVKGQES
jgi:D-beta-D-heptose 7-phosphate kinase/D-beta-D-heptose 1-phosphate adenosyltransferase